MTLSDEDRRRIEEEELSKRTLESEQASQSRRKWDEAEYRKQTRARLKREDRFLGSARASLSQAEGELEDAESYLEDAESHLKQKEDYVEHLEAHVQARRAWVKQLEQDPTATPEPGSILAPTVESAREDLEYFLVQLEKMRRELEEEPARVEEARADVKKARASVEANQQWLERATQTMKHDAFVWLIIKLVVGVGVVALCINWLLQQEK